MDLLVVLVERCGELVTRDEIIAQIWGKDVFLDTDGSINSAIRKIRQAFNDHPEEPRFVQTVSGRGYRFIAPIMPISSGSQPPADVAVVNPEGAPTSSAAERANAPAVAAGNKRRWVVPVVALASAFAVARL
jgi:DNA-binding winged helix-turn-helix (wHTH) protein